MSQGQIDYKGINKSGFFQDRYKAEPEVEVNNLKYSGKYISNDFQKRLKKDAVDTTIINAGVGSGKSKLGYDLMIEYASKGFVVIVASPFIVLTEKDYKELSTIAPSDMKIVNYSSLTKDNVDSFVDAAIHVATIHLILGDPGQKEKTEVSQAKYKISYLEGIRSYCRDNNKKVVLFFDEVHESSSSFKPQLAINLYKWKGLVQKAFVLSATFTEPSYTVLSLIGAITSNRITVFNYERKRVEKPADLHLRITFNRYSSRNLTPLHDMIDVIREAITKEKGVHIHTASKSLAEALTDPLSNDPLAKYIVELEPNILTSLSEGVFDEKRFNIGTRFGTGVNLGSDNVYIVVLPSVTSESQGSYGTFSNGYTAVIQTLARVRESGEVYVYMSKPSRVIEGDYTGAFEDFLDGIETVKDHQLDEEYELIESAYNEEYSSINTVEDDGLYKELMSEKKLSFIEYMLTQGHYQMVQRYESYGKGIAPYLVKAAYTGQFCNCELKSVQRIDPGEKVVRVSDSTDLEGLISNTLLEFLEFYEDAEAFKLLQLEMIKSVPNQGIAVPDVVEEGLGDPEKTEPVHEIPDEVSMENMSLITDKKAAIELKKQLEDMKLSNKVMYEGVVIQDNVKASHSFINKGLIEILYRNRFGQSNRYTKEVYIRSSIYQASNRAKPALIKRELSQEDKLRVKLLNRTYQDMEKVRQRFLKAIKKDVEKPLGVHLIDVATERMVCRVLDVLRREDHFIKNGIFSFLRTLTFKYDLNGDLVFTGNCKDEGVRRGIIYRELKKLFVKTKRTTAAVSERAKGRTEVEIYKNEVPLESQGLRLFEY